MAKKSSKKSKSKAKADPTYVVDREMVRHSKENRYYLKDTVIDLSHLSAEKRQRLLERGAVRVVDEEPSSDDEE